MVEREEMKKASYELAVEVFQTELIKIAFERPEISKADLIKEAKAKAKERLGLVV